jgi:RNA polymerase sigma-70 factor (ECF subfamily)
VTAGNAEPGTVETVGSGTAWFDTFRDEGQLRLRVALASAYGGEVGEESAADAVAYAWEHRDRLAEMVNPLGYLFRVGQSAARRHRRRWRGVALPAVGSAYEDRVDTDLPQALAELTERQRVAVVLVHVNGWTLEETATAMELSVSTVRTHVDRALTRLEQLLKEDDR